MRFSAGYYDGKERVTSTVSLRILIALKESVQAEAVFELFPLVKKPLAWGRENRTHARIDSPNSRNEPAGYLAYIDIITVQVSS
jgi:hypothetical protein